MVDVANDLRLWSGEVKQVSPGLGQGFLFPHAIILFSFSCYSCPGDFCCYLAQLLVNRFLYAKIYNIYIIAKHYNL